MNRVTRRPRAGFTLVELLVVMSILGMLISLGIGLMLGTLRTHDADAALWQRITVQGTLADTFRADVASAAAAPPRAGEFTASARCLILRRPNRNLIVYQVAEGALERIEVAGDDMVRRPLPLGNDRTSAELERGGKDDRLLTLRQVETRGSEGSPIRRIVEITAALGGDLR